jgi:hypothetical protein
VTSERDHLEAIAFCATVNAIRKAKGRLNPEELPLGSLERMLAEVDLISDALRMLGLDVGIEGL